MSNSKYTEIAKHLDVDEKTVQQWDKLRKNVMSNECIVRIGKLLRKY